MLVLSGQISEKILIGGDVIVTIVKIQGNKVRLGVQAPKDVEVLRSTLEPHKVAQIEANIAQRDAEIVAEQAQQPRG